jgi:hypothetical protein
MNEQTCDIKKSRYYLWLVVVAVVFFLTRRKAARLQLCFDCVAIMEEARVAGILIGEGRHTAPNESTRALSVGEKIVRVFEHAAC